jgi:hypothetical protein
LKVELLVALLIVVCVWLTNDGEAPQVAVADVVDTAEVVVVVAGAV